MKKIAAIALGATMIASVASAQTPPTKPVTPQGQPQVTIAGGIGAGGLALALLPLLLLALLGGGSNSTTTTTN